MDGLYSDVFNLLLLLTGSAHLKSTPLPNTPQNKPVTDEALPHEGELAWKN